MLNGLIKPDTGRIEMKGRVGALIALGAGFNPILTGRENIYTNASVLGLGDEEIKPRIEEIIDFAEINDFIDSPVQTYSSGMQVRLGFAIATALNPDILILDEVLAVGDSGFRFKCYEMIDKLLSRTAVIFVSHNMPDIGRICTKSIYMTKGESTPFSSAEEAVEFYNNQNTTGLHSTGFIKVRHPVESIEIYCEEEALWNTNFVINYTLDLAEIDSELNLIIDVFNQSSDYVGSARRNLRELGVTLEKGRNNFQVSVKSLPFKNGKYALATHILKGREFVASHSKMVTINISGGKSAIASPCYLDLSNSHF